MKLRKFLYILLLVCTFILTGCKYDRGLILFNTEPINQYNVTHDKKVFNTDSRVYYLFIAPKKMKGGFIRVQIFKMTDKAPWGGNEVVRTKDYRLMQDERYYHTNYFVLHEKGRYVLQVFSHDDLLTPLAVNYFYVE